MSKFENLLETAKLNELLNKKEEKKEGHVVLWILAIVGAVAMVAAIAYAVYCYLTPDYFEDLDDDMDDDFDDDFFEDEDEEI